MSNLIKIEGDLYDISGRLREIDPRYELYRNMKLHRFEIHANGALQIAVPYARLDERTLSLARQTRVENADKLLKLLEGDNQKLLRAQCAAEICG